VEQNKTDVEPTIAGMRHVHAQKSISDGLGFAEMRVGMPVIRWTTTFVMRFGSKNPRVQWD
jgi:hypothetical protein